MPTLEHLLIIAEEMFREGYTRSEAYPVFRWKKNGWPDINDRLAFKIMDAYLRLAHLKAEYPEQ